MSGDRYYIADQNAMYFITPTVVGWIDVFSRENYRSVIVDSLNYCIKNKGLIVYSWVIMSNHLHLVIQAKEGYQMSSILRDFKKHTSKEILKQIQLMSESRRKWMLSEFSFEANRTKRSKDFKLWQDSNHAMCLDNIDVWQKINYIHNNPVKAGLVYEPHHYIYSSATDYAGKRGLVDIELIL